MTDHALICRCRKRIDGLYRTGFDFHGLDMELNATTGGGLGSGIYQPPQAAEHSSSDSEFEDALPHSPTRETSPTVPKFDFDQCQPDQMMVFDAKQVDIILAAILKDLRIPHVSRASQSSKFATANTIFLCARYAHYFAGEELLNGLMQPFCEQVRSVSKSPEKVKDMSHHAYWLANLSQMLYLFKKDSGLMQTTAFFQVELSELIQEVFTRFVNESRLRLINTCVQSIGAFQSIAMDVGALEKRVVSGSLVAPGAATNKDDQTTGLFGMFSRLTKRTDQDDGPDSGGALRYGSTSNAHGSMSPLGSPAIQRKGQTRTVESPATASARISQFFSSFTSKPPPPKTLSPRTLLTHLASTMFLLQSYHVHPLYQRQVIEQLMFTLGAELFNAFMDGRIEVSRARAISVRMNLSVVEEWIRLRFVSRIASKPNSPTRSATTPHNRTTVDGLLKAIPVDDVDSLISPLQPAITICKLLQIVTTTFNDSQLKNESDESIVNLLEDTIRADSFQHSSLFVGENSDMVMNFEQLTRLLDSNYQYEKGEPSISSRFISLIKQRKDKELSKSLEEVKLQSSNQDPSDLISFDSPPKKKRVFMVDAYNWLPFRLQSTYVSVGLAQPAHRDESDWGDKNERDGAKRRKELQERRDRDDERWWSRVKIEVPEWVTKYIDERRPRSP